MTSATSRSGTHRQLLLQFIKPNGRPIGSGLPPARKGRVPLMALGMTLALIAAILTPTYLNAQNPPAAGATAYSSLSSAALDGKVIFQQKCGFCHGADGSGGAGPDLLHSSLVLHDENGNLIVPVVQGGRAGKGMPAFDLPRPAIEQIAAFLHKEIKADATIFGQSMSDYSLDRMLVGDAAAGKAYFEGEGKCATCHSPTGNLAHIASRYKPIELQSRIAYPAGATTTVTVTTASGAIVSGDEVYADRFSVSLRDANGWLHSFDRSKVKVEVRNPLAEHQKLLETYTDKQLHDLFAYLETFK
jgi:cytochrome c oxidase cbb3-type subunit 3